MKMRKFFAAMLLIAMAFSTSALKAQSMGRPIPVDDQVRVGKLDCGLTYYIRHNDYPEHRVNFYIAQRVGSIQEEESQRGLAHFLEHMAFNGSEHFNGEGKGIIDYTRSLGVAFGKDLNAYTSIAETVYNINDVPSTRQSAIDSCLLILKDWSNGLLLTDEEIDKERGVIHEEWRLRRSAMQRMLENQLETLYPGSKYGRRMPIGLMEVVDNFKYKELRDYYHKWYRPDNQALVIVGDVDVDHIEAQIKELFKGVPAPGPDAAQVVPEPVPDNDEPIIVVDKDKEQQYSQVMVMFKHEAMPKEIKGDQMYMVIDFAKSMMSSMLNDRLSEKAQDPDCPYIQAYAMDGGYLLSQDPEAFTLTVLPKDGQIEAATEAVVTEAMRAAKHGFTATEYDRAKEEYMSRLEKQYNERNKIPNARLAAMYYRNYLDNEPMPSIEQEYQIMSQYAPMLPVDLVNQIMPGLISTTGENLVVVNFNQEKDGAVYPTPESLKAAVDAGLNAQVEAFVDNVKQEPLIKEMPNPGKILKETVNNRFDYKELELSNGARVILKKTDFKENEIRMSAFQRGGASLYGEQDWVNTELLPLATMMSGLGEFSYTELQKALAGKQASVGFSMDTYSDGFSGQSTVKDLETLFQLTYLNFTDMRKDEKSFNMIKGQVETMLKNRNLDPENVFEDSVNYILANHDWRSRPFDVSYLNQIDLDRMMQIAKERTANAANYTFIFVGAFDEAVIRPLIEQYIASLPGQKGMQSNFVNVESHPVGQTVTHFTNKSETPKAIAQIYWYDTKTPYSLENQIKANILGQVLSKIYLQKIREDAGAAYSAGARGWSTYEGNNVFTAVMASCPMKPEMADMAVKIMNEEIYEACNNIDATTLKEIKELMIKDHGTSLKENGYWLRQIYNYLFTGADGHTGFDQIVNAQTPETIAAFARQLLNAGNKVEVVMLPEE
ncbi:MAG: insulinase family protein [Muribaculaceae bacterium]|nr:insulinase family protein [Muribaculaceae bacterium]